MENSKKKKNRGKEDEEEKENDTIHSYVRPRFRLTNKGQYVSLYNGTLYNREGLDVEGFNEDGFKKIRGKYYHRDTGTIFNLQGETYESIKSEAIVFPELSKELIDRGFNENGINIYTGTIYDLNNRTVDEPGVSYTEVSFVDMNGEIPIIEDPVFKKSMVYAKEMFQDINDGRSIDDIIFNYAVKNHISPMEAEYKIRGIFKVALDAEMGNIKKDWRLDNKPRKKGTREAKEIEKLMPNYFDLLKRNKTTHQMVRANRVFKDLKNGKSMDAIISTFAEKNNFSIEEARMILGDIVRNSLEAETKDLPSQYRLDSLPGESNLEEIKKLVPEYEDIIRKQASMHLKQVNDRNKNRNINNNRNNRNGSWGNKF